MAREVLLEASATSVEDYLKQDTEQTQDRINSERAFFFFFFFNSVSAAWSQALNLAHGESGGRGLSED